MSNKLTIAIPTYNRNNELNRLIDSLSNQIDDSVNIIIYDNHSTKPVEDTIIDDSFKNNSKVKIIRNANNIGGNANILKCFENCETDWIWVIGDDDLLDDKAVCTVLDAIKLYSNALLLSFSSSQHLHNESKILENLEEFISNIKYWGHINFSSVNLFNWRVLKKHIKSGYQFAYSYSPHLALVFKELNDRNGKVIFLKEKIIKEVALADIKNKWAPMDPAYSKLILPELLTDYKLRKQLTKALSKSPSDYYVLLHFIFLSMQESRKDSIYKFNSFMNRKYLYNQNFIVYIKIIIMKVILKFYKIPILLIKIFSPKLFKMFNIKYDNSRY